MKERINSSLLYQILCSITVHDFQAFQIELLPPSSSNLPANRQGTIIQMINIRRISFTHPVSLFVVKDHMFKLKLQEFDYGSFFQSTKSFYSASLTFDIFSSSRIFFFFSAENENQSILQYRWTTAINRVSGAKN